MPSRTDSIEWTPAICFGVLGLAQLSVFWFEAYRILSVAFLALAFVLLVVAARPGQALPVGRSALWSFLAVYAYMTLAVLWAPRPADAGVEIAKAFAVSLPPFAFGWVLARRFSLQSIGSGLAPIPIAFALQALYNLKTYGDAMRIEDFSLRTHLAGLICLAAPVLLARYLSSRSTAALCSCLVIVGLALSIESRSSLLIVAPALMYVVRAHSRRMFRLGALALLVAFVAGTAVFVSGGSVGRFSAESTSFDISEAVVDELTDQSNEGVDLERRVHAFIAANLFVANPIFGAGYSSVLQAFVDQLNLEVPSHGYVPGTLAELGLVGIGLISFFVWQFFRLLASLIARMPRSAQLTGKGFAAGFGALVAYGFFHQTFEWAYFPMLAGVLLGASVMRAKQTDLARGRT